MKRIIRLTERDLTRMVKRVLLETPFVSKCIKGNCKGGYGIEKDDGYEYKGNFDKLGWFTGYGVLTLSSGGVYKGNFKNGGPGGYGVFTNKNGRVFKGTFGGGTQWVFVSGPDPKNKQFERTNIGDLENIKKDDVIISCPKPPNNVNTIKSDIDKNYEYVKYNGEELYDMVSIGCWWAKNIKTGNWFNLTELVKTKPEIQKSIDKLNKDILNYSEKTRYKYKWQ
jgi:hypothetical protein